MSDIKSVIGLTHRDANAFDQATEGVENIDLDRQYSIVCGDIDEFLCGIRAKRYFGQRSGHDDSIEGRAPPSVVLISTWLPSAYATVSDDATIVARPFDPKGPW